MEHRNRGKHPPVVVVVAMSLALLVLLLLPGPTTVGAAGSADLPSLYVESNGIRVHYKSAGSGEAAVVFVHGGGCDLSVWDAQVEPVAAAYRVILVDLPGHGGSDKPHVSYTPTLFAEAVATVLDDAGVRRAVLVGHSLGWPVCLHLVRMKPERAAGLVNVDGCMEFVPEEPEEAARWQEQARGFIDTFRVEDYRGTVAQFVESLFRESTPEPVRVRVREMMLATPRHVALVSVEGLADPAVWPGDPVCVKTLVVYAEWPELNTPEFMSALRAQFPDMEYHGWKDVGHFLMMERPEAFNVLLLDFVRQSLK